MLIKLADIPSEIDFVDDMIFEARSIFKPGVDKYPGSDLEAFEQYRAYLMRKYKAGHCAKRPAEIESIRERWIREQEKGSL